MPDDEINSAEAEAEEILKQEFTKIEEECPAGDDCPVHHRLDQSIIDQDQRWGRIITYAGNYAVITTDNPDLDDPRLLLKLVFGKISKEDLPDRYETAIIHVGESTLQDVRDLDRDGQKAAVRFIQTHNDWDNFESAHESVVSAVKDGMIDLSRSTYEEK